MLLTKKDLSHARPAKLTLKLGRYLAKVLFFLAEEQSQSEYIFFPC